MLLKGAIPTWGTRNSHSGINLGSKEMADYDDSFRNQEHLRMIIEECADALSCNKKKMPCFRYRERTLRFGS